MIGRDWSTFSLFSSPFSSGFLPVMRGGFLIKLVCIYHDWLSDIAAERRQLISSFFVEAEFVLTQLLLFFSQRIIQFLISAASLFSGLCLPQNDARDLVTDTTVKRIFSSLGIYSSERLNDRRRWNGGEMAQLATLRLVDTAVTVCWASPFCCHQQIGGEWQESSKKMARKWQENGKKMARKWQENVKKMSGKCQKNVRKMQESSRKVAGTGSV